jgi:hypothetical protein
MCHPVHSATTLASLSYPQSKVIESDSQLPLTRPDSCFAMYSGEGERKVDWISPFPLPSRMPVVTVGIMMFHHCLQMVAKDGDTHW